MARHRPTRAKQQSLLGLATLTPPPLIFPKFRSGLPPAPLFPLFTSVDDTNIKAGPTLGVAVMAWLFGLVGTITIMYLNSRVTSAHEGPLRQFMSRGGGVARGASAEQQVGTV